MLNLLSLWRSLYLFQLLINPCFNFFSIWPLMICKSCLPLAYTLLDRLLQPIGTINSFNFIEHLKFILLRLITLFVVFFIRIQRISFILFLLLFSCLSLLLLDRLIPVILKLLYTLKPNVEIQAFQIVSTPVLLRLSMPIWRAEPLRRSLLLVLLFLSIKLFPKGLGLRQVEIKAIHCIEELLFLLLSLRYFNRCRKSLSLKERLLLRVEFRQKELALKLSIAKNRLFTFFAGLSYCLWLA